MNPLWHEPEGEVQGVLVLTHGAGSNAEAPVLIAVANAFAKAGYGVQRHTLAFREARPRGSPHPSTAARDREGLEEAVERVRGRGRMLLGGHSYGGRQASMLLAEKPGLVDALVLLSYPLHPPQKPESFRKVAISKDGGKILGETTTDSTLIEAPAQASLLRYSLAGHGRGVKNRLLFANPAAPKRERMTVRLSYDEGTTWPVSRLIYEGPSAYSCLVVLRDRTIGLLYERGVESPYDRIIFTRFTLGWLTTGEDAGD